MTVSLEVILFLMKSQLSRRFGFCSDFSPFTSLLNIHVLLLTTACSRCFYLQQSISSRGAKLPVNTPFLVLRFPCCDSLSVFLFYKLLITPRSDGTEKQSRIQPCIGKRIRLLRFYWMVVGRWLPTQGGPLCIHFLLELEPPLPWHSK
jgi:hypothetical protein